MKTRRLVLIEWVDSQGAKPNWQAIDGDSPVIVTAKSVGWLIYDGKDRKRIVPHIVNGTSADDPDQGCGDMVIPTVAITRMINLKIPARKKRR